MNTGLRVIQDSDRSPDFNMAADRLLLKKALETDMVHLRLYGWNPPAISLGYMQNPEELLDLEKMKLDSVGYVRRPTGGRAVLHWDDLTYCCAFPKSARMGKNIGESYSMIARCLRQGLHNAGIPTQTSDSELDSREVRREIKLPCFLAPNRDEIMVKGRKLVGSAQKRTEGAVLQHGSIPIGDSYRRLPAYMRLDGRQRTIQEELLRRKTICTSELNRELAAGNLAQWLIEGFASVLQTSPILGGWTEPELRQIQEIKG